jgi:hypothetical protein
MDAAVWVRKRSTIEDSLYLAKDEDVLLKPNVTSTWNVAVNAAAVARFVSSPQQSRVCPDSWLQTTLSRSQTGTSTFVALAGELLEYVSACAVQLPL